MARCTVLAMTPLKAFILAQLAQRGPMRDIELWQHSTERNLLPVTLACLELEQEQYIEKPRGVRPVSYDWQLTEKGLRHCMEQRGAGDGSPEAPCNGQEATPIGG